MAFGCRIKDWKMARSNGLAMQTGAKKLSSQQIRWLLEGLAIEQPKAIKNAKTRTIY